MNSSYCLCSEVTDLTGTNNNCRLFLYPLTLLFITNQLNGSIKSISCSCCVMTMMLQQQTHFNTIKQKQRRYKCIALNKAGNASFEYLLRVGGSPARDQLSSAASPLSNAANSNGMLRDTTHSNNGNNKVKTATSSLGFQHHLRDQRAQQQKQQVLTQQQQEMEQQASRRKDLGKSHLAAQSSNQQQQQQQQQATQTHLVPSNTWLKSSATFQVTIVVVSILMAAVIIAFLLICIVIYQIKPSSAQTILPDSETQNEDATGCLLYWFNHGFGDATSNSTPDLTTPHSNALQQQQQESRLIPKDDNNQNLTESLLMSETPFFMANNNQPVPVPILATITNPISGTSPIHLIATDHHQNRSMQTPIHRQQQQMQALHASRASPMQTIDAISGFTSRPQNYPQSYQVQSRINSPVSSNLNYGAGSVQQIDQQQQHFVN